MCIEAVWKCLDKQNDILKERASFAIPRKNVHEILASTPIFDHTRSQFVLCVTF